MLGSEDMALPQKNDIAPVNEMLDKLRQDSAMKQRTQAANEDHSNALNLIGQPVATGIGKSYFSSSVHQYIYIYV